MAFGYLGIGELGFIWDLVIGICNFIGGYKPNHVKRNGEKENE